MAKITNLQLAESFKRCLNEGMGYVWGLNGELFTKELAEARRKGGYSVPPGRSRETYFTVDCAKWYGRRCADCSGGIVYAIRQYDPTYADRSADSFKAQFTESGPVKSIPEIPGLAVWKSGHIGIYIGNGEVIEFQGTAYGCVKTRLASRTFTHWGRLAGVDYGAQNAAESGAGQPQPAAETPFYAEVTGGSVHVRSGCANTAASLLVAHKGDLLLALPQKDGWHAVALYGGGAFVAGFMSARYVRAVKA